jgi:enoyl-CoA hydratase
VIERRDSDGIRTLKLAHGKVSAMDLELGEALIGEFKEAADPSVTAVIVTGTGASFSAGVDLFRLIKDGPEYARRFVPVLDEFLLATLTFPKPVVAAINGHAIAGGCILAAACDHRIMTEGNGRIGIAQGFRSRECLGRDCDHGRGWIELRDGRVERLPVHVGQRFNPIPSNPTTKCVHQ